MIKNVHLVYFSPCGGTEKIVKALGRDIPLPKQEYNITLPKSRVQELLFNPDDFVIMGFPVYGGHMPLFFSSFIAHLKGTGTPMAMAAIYGNREYEAAFWDMEKEVRTNGFHPIAAIAAVAEHSAAPHIASGRPDTDDREALAQFGLQALHKAQTSKGVFNAPGVYPSLNIPPGLDVYPNTNMDACKACGLCSKVCPNSAIPADAPHTTIKDKCMVCGACIKNCPTKARQFGNEETEKEYKSHIKNAVIRKEAAIFL